MRARWRSTEVLVGLVALALGSACNCGSSAKGGLDGGTGGQATAGASNGGSGGSAGGGGCGLVTCEKAKANCGALGDGCGDIIQCGSCPSGEQCGAAGPNVCGNGGGTGSGGAIGGAIGGGTGGTGGATCTTGLCTQIAACTPTTQTTLTGTVYAGTDPTLGYGNPDPLPNALVYIPNAPLVPFAPGVTCDPCGAPVSGDPIVSTISGDDGTFMLTGVPSGANIPIVVQIGHWRREVTIANVPSCQTTALTSDDTRMPRGRGDGVVADLPLIAMVTGNVDLIECVLRKMGIADPEFTVPGPDAGRVHIWEGNGATDPTSSAQQELTLTSDSSTLDNYDEVIFACWGSEDGQPASPDQPVAQVATNQQNLIDYANAGGRVYATHFSYVWLDNDQSKDNGNPNLPVGPVPFDGTATWDLNAGTETDNQTLDVNTGFSRGAQFARWLQVVGASTTYGEVPLGILRNDFTASVPPSETWLYWDAGVATGGGNGGHSGGGNGGSTWDGPEHYTFDTPVGATPASQCGRVVFSDFHVENSNGDQGTPFPSECSATPMTPQEKVLEYMLFNLSSCTLTSTPTGTCVPQTCSQLGYDCGQAGDGCGGTIECGGGSACFEGTNCGCDAGTCGGAGEGNVCGTASGFE